MKTLISVLIFLAVLVGGYLFYVRRGSDTVIVPNVASSTSVTTDGTASTTANMVSTEDIKITSPTYGQAVSFPLTVSGLVRGNWFFEASAPVYVVDSNGKKIAQGTINAQGDWMTTNFVPFTGTFTWPTGSIGTSTKGSIIFMNDNPSGNPTLQKAVTVPVTFLR